MPTMGKKCWATKRNGVKKNHIVHSWRPNVCRFFWVSHLFFFNSDTTYFLDSVPSLFFGRVFTCKMGAVFHWKCGCNFLTGFAAVKSRPSDLLAQLSEIHSKSSKNNQNNEDFPLDFRRSRRRIFLRVFSFSNLGSHYFFDWVFSCKSANVSHSKFGCKFATRELSCKDGAGWPRRAALSESAHASD